MQWDIEMTTQCLLQDFNKINTCYCVYQIKCRVSGKIYIGSTQNFRVRFTQHVNDLKSNRHHNRHLQNAFNCYGIESFSVEVLQEFEYHENKSKTKYSKTTMRQILEKAEQECIEKINKENLYNTSTQTRSFFFGCKHTEQAKKKIRDAKLKNNYIRGKTFEEYFGIEKAKQLRNNISKTWTPWKTICEHTKQAKIKMSQNKKGKPLGPQSEDHKIKLSQANIGKHDHSGEKNPMFGKKGAFTGKIWINKETIEKPILPCDLEFYINLGWLKGRKHKQMVCA
jgi:group I intron endonuclease